MQDKENFYSQLNAIVDEVPTGNIKIYTDDFNATIDSDNTDYERVMGRHGLGEMCENGELFAEFCGNNGIVIGGSLFPHRPVHKVTWVSCDGYTENQIDHIGISQKWRWSLFDVRNKRSADIASDHHLLIGEIRLRIARFTRSFVEELEIRAEGIPEGGNVEEQWTAIKNAFIETRESKLGQLRTQRKE